ncbi:ATP-binding protein [Acinetobacter soli]|uniref:AAA family ATPase n=1 Tax=Acinetobacter soli TaxID=487316 RepID=A0AB38YXU4_9GAMM|nr:AAA family ATPase [Acinetobacter soli]WND06090.1 AAA family ATPase [Acinetobacter soli]
MKLKSIRLKHIGPFQNLDVQFDYAQKPVTLILGEHSSGKTTLLKHLFQALSWFPARFKDARAAGIVMQDQDISFQKTQAKIQLDVQFPAEIGVITESSDVQQYDAHGCTWRLFKTLSASGTGISQVDTQQLEQLVSLYQHAIHQDPLQGLPLIAYYPADRFIHEVNLLSKNIPAVFQPVSAYETVTPPYTTFARFFEWLREVSDVENAQAAQLLQRVTQHDEDSNAPPLEEVMFHAQAQLKTPHLQALKNSLQMVFPELTDLYLEYHPKLQLMVHYQGQLLPYQQLSNSLKVWIALVGDVVRRLCLLNPFSLYPCLEGEGILMIDHIDAQLDHQLSHEILKRLSRAFPAIQIIATGNRDELLEHASDYQSLKLIHFQIHTIEPSAPVHLYDQIYNRLFNQATESAPDESPCLLAGTEQLDGLVTQIQSLSPEQKQQLIQLLKPDLPSDEPHVDSAR